MRLKKMIPNILTSLRILVIPFIVYLGLYEKYKALAILVAVISLTDFFDGYLARKFNVVSKLGAMLDTFGDKLFAISFLILLILKRHIFIPLLVLELLIAIVNLTAYYKTRITNTRFIGKVKTWSLSVSGILGTVNLFFPKIHVLMDFFIVLTIILQVITLLLYSKDLADISKKKISKR